MLKKHAAVIKDGSTGRKHQHKVELCPECHGEGKKWYDEEWPSYESTRKVCDVCLGSGRVITDIDITYFPYHEKD